MNVSKLTLPQQCKAFSDAAEFNRQKVEKLAVLHHFAYDQSAKAKASRLSVMAVHKSFAELFGEECKRLQLSLNNQRTSR